MLKYDCYRNKELNKPFEYWAVTMRGNIVLQSQKGYFISAKDLGQKNWLEYVRSQNYAPEVKEEFRYAYKQAIINAGFRFVIVDLIDPNFIILLR